MDIEDLKIAFAEHPQIKAIEERITKKGDRHVLVSGLYASSRSLVLERLSQILSRKKATRGESLFIIMDNAESAQYLYSDLCQIQGTKDKVQGTKDKGQRRKDVWCWDHEALFSCRSRI